MNKFYYYVEPCPRCKSRKTGRYVRQPITGSGYMMEESLKAGELIRFLSFEPEKNGFCVTCGHEWHTRAKLKFWPKEKIREEQIVRGTDQEYARFLQQNSGDKKAKTAYTVPQEPKKPERDMTFVDRRPKPVVELIYFDEELFAKIEQ